MKRKLTFAVVITEMTIFWVFTSCMIGANATFSRNTLFPSLEWQKRILAGKWKIGSTFLKNRCQP